MKYAGMVADAKMAADAEATALMAARDAASDAAGDAQAAADAAKTAVEDVDGIKIADPSSYAIAVIERDKAAAAAMAAKAASDAAAMATSSADAKAQQMIAEAEKAKAEMARMNAMTYAGLVTAAQDGMNEQKAEEMKLTAARTAASNAAEAAKTASDDAAAQVAAQDDNQVADQASYNAAAAAAQTAMDAYMAAKAASEAAAAATTSADAEAQREIAVAKQGEAQDALADAMKYAGMVQMAQNELNAKAEEMEMLTAAKSAAMTAAVAARKAATDARAAANRVAELDPGSPAAMDAAEAARMAEDQALLAEEASKLAQDAGTSAEAEMHQATAEKYRNSAQGHQSTADGEMMMAEGRKTEADNRAKYQGQAATAATAAREAATKARAAATKIAELLGAGSTAAMKADVDATNAETAATAAELAETAANEATTSADAMTEKDTAEEKRGDAERVLAELEMEQAKAQVAFDANQESRRVTDIAAAKKAAGDAVAAAKTAMDNAAQAATEAEKARDDAMAEYMRAMAARTDSKAAKAEYEKAETAAMEAREAANDADAAYMAAKMAAGGIMDAGTVEDAQMAQTDAEMAKDDAETAEGTANTQKMAAETAMTAAMTAADTHVLSLFLAANGAHVMDDDAGTDDNETADHVKDVGMAMAAIAAAPSGNQAGATTASATYPGDMVDNPATPDNDEFAEGMLSITVNVAGTAIPFELGATRAADSTVTPAVEARTQTAKKIADLGAFQGYDLWEDDGNAETTTDRARALVFTDKKKGKDSVLQVTATTARSVRGHEVTAATELAKVTSTGDTITGVEWTPSGEAGALTGTLTCGSTDSCSITLGENGAVTAISGYKFTGSRAATKRVDAADPTENNDYLIFGLWLDEGDNGDNDAFGAFAKGGTDYDVDVQQAVTGTATYSGKAAGAHHKTGEGVNWFDGDASLTAEFGTADADGTIHGSVSNIRVNGGEAMSTPIYLGQAALSNGTATFNGAAFMGAATAPGAATHEFDGTWSGSFFGATANDPDTTDDESVTAPKAAAGTFGVTRTEGMGDDMVVESYVGAFGAHKE